MGFNNQGKVVNVPAPNSGKASDANAEVTPTAAELSNLDALQMLLDIVGLIPGFGAPADVLNGIISAGRGDFVGAALSIFGVVPIAGEAATLAKIAKNSEKYLQALKVVEGKVLPLLPAGARRKVQEALDAARKKLDELLKKDKPAAPKPATSTPPPPTNPPGTKVKPKRMKKHEPKCFKKNAKGDPKEYDRQLSDQEKGLNDLTVKEYLEGRAKYQQIGRHGTGAAQQAARAKYSKELTGKFEKELSKSGASGDIGKQAAQMAKDKMDTLAALHNPDMIAGGKDAVTKMGDKGVNSSIGSQWKDRVAEMDKAAKDVPASERGNTKMDTKLKRCP